MFIFMNTFLCFIAYWRFGCEANTVLERRAVPWQDIKARQPGTAALATPATAAYGFMCVARRA